MAVEFLRLSEWCPTLTKRAAIARLILFGVAFTGCGSQPRAEDDVGNVQENLSPKSVVACCRELFEQSSECGPSPRGTKPTFDRLRTCAKEEVALVRNRAVCVERGLRSSGLCGAPTMFSPANVQATCGSNGTALDGSSCVTIKPDAALAVVADTEAAALAAEGLTVTRQPDLAADGFFTAEVSLARTSPLWSDIGTVELPSPVAGLKAGSPEVLRSLFLALWLRQHEGVRHARPIQRLVPNAAILTSIKDTFYNAAGDLLSTSKAKLVNLRESWQVLQFASFGRSEIRLAVVDAGFTSNNSDLDNPLDFGPIGEPGHQTGKEWHGHWVASVAGSVGNNGSLVSGTSALAVQNLDTLNPKPALRVLRVHVGTFWDPELGAGIGRAIDAGADIVNLSWSENCDSACQFFEYDDELDPVLWALRRARDERVVVTAAAGNQHADLNASNRQQIPCEMGVDLVLCVGAVDDSGGLASFSNFNGAVALYAPGIGVPVAAEDGFTSPIRSVNGTSFSAPFVAGVLSGVVALQGRVGTRWAYDLVTSSASAPGGLPVLDAARAMRRAATPAADRLEGGDYVDPLPTTGELLTLTDEDSYSFSASLCESVEISIEYVPLKEGAQAPYVELTGPSFNAVPLTISDAPGKRVVLAGPLDAAAYGLVLGRRPSPKADPQLPLGYRLAVRRMPGANCENAALAGSTFPTEVTAGNTFFAAVTFKNTGATRWQPGSYSMRADVGDTTFSFANGLPVNFFVDPGESFTGTLQLKAPSEVGTYPLRLRMYHDGLGFFGASSPQADITVKESTGEDARFEPPAGDVPPRVCQAPAIFRYTLVNQGAVAWSPDFTLQTYRHEAGISAPWQPWMSAPLGRSVLPGDRITIELTLDRIDIPGFWEVRADLLNNDLAVGAGSAPAQTGIGLYDNSDSNNDAQLRAYTTPAGVDEGEAGFFEVGYHNSGCNPWSSTTGYYLESLAGHWNPATIGLNGVVVPVNGDLTLSFTATATAYDVVNGESVNFTEWHLRNATWMGPTTGRRTIPIAHAYAECEFVNVPRIMTAGQAFPAVIRMKNTGGTTWTRAVGYHLGYTPPNDTTWGPAFIELEPNDRIEPGQTKEFRWMGKAPSAPGQYPFFWMMYRDGSYFFDQCGPSEPISVQ